MYIQSTQTKPVTCCPVVIAVRIVESSVNICMLSEPLFFWLWVLTAPLLRISDISSSWAPAFSSSSFFLLTSSSRWGKHSWAVLQRCQPLNLNKRHKKYQVDKSQEILVGWKHYRPANWQPTLAVADCTQVVGRERCMDSKSPNRWLDVWSRYQGTSNKR